jgi:glucose-6-phosphate isomerase, archaeal
MHHLKIIRPPVEVNLGNYELTGSPVINQRKRLKDLDGIFYDKKAFARIDLQQTAYTVQAWLPVAEGTPGGLYFGTTNLFPGKVGNEFFMTRGHLHTLSDRSEFYWGIRGNGMLIMMDQNRNTWAEQMQPGSLHYIQAHIAHRVANTGDSTLIFGACWPSDAGHDYDSITMTGFSARLVEIDMKPELISNI